MGRFFPSEYVREPQAQEYWVNKALEKVQPMLKEAGKKGMDCVSTVIRPKKNYLTNRKDLDGGGYFQTWFPFSTTLPGRILAEKERALTFTRRSENFPNRKADGLCQAVGIQGLIIL